MFNQRILLRVLIGSLAAAALLWASVVLAAPGEVTDKMLGTLLLTAAASGILMAVARWYSEPSVRAAGMLATVLVAIEFSLGTSLVWEIPKQFDLDPFKVLSLMLSLGAPGAAAVHLLAWRKRPAMAVASWMGLLLCAAWSILWLFATAQMGRHDSANQHFWEYGLWLAMMGLLACCSAVGHGTDWKYWRWLGVIFAAVAYADACVMTSTSQFLNGNWPMEPLTAYISAAALVAHANLALRTPLKHGQRWIIYFTIAAAAAAVVLTNITAMDVDAHRGSTWSISARLAASCGILAGFGSLILAILAQIARKSAAPAPGNIPTTITLTCPICGQKQTLPLGTGGCGARFSIQVQPAQPTAAAPVPFLHPKASL